MKIIAGPCSVETLEQMMNTAQALHACGVKILRGGIWKPRSRAYQFEGLGEEGLRYLYEVTQQTGMECAVEVGKADQVELALKYGIKHLWIGARTTTNPYQMNELAASLKGAEVAVYLKNPVCPDTELWIGAIERILAVDIQCVSLIHRGFCLLNNAPYRNTPLWELVERMRQEFPHLPIYCDPSHIAGNSDLLPSIIEQAHLLHYDGLFIESHCCPSQALTDARQQITPDKLAQLLQTQKITIE